MINAEVSLQDWYCWYLASGCRRSAAFPIELDKATILKLRGQLMQTLSEFHKSHFVPLWIQGRQLDQKTEASYRHSIAWWSRLTDDPPLDQITDHTVARSLPTYASSQAVPAR